MDRGEYRHECPICSPDDISDARRRERVQNLKPEGIPVVDENIDEVEWTKKAWTRQAAKFSPVLFVGTNVWSGFAAQRLAGV